jgi:serine/threonine protein kinase
MVRKLGWTGWAPQLECGVVSMNSELSDRIALASDELRRLHKSEAEIYVANLRHSDPELAAALDSQQQQINDSPENHGVASGTAPNSRGTHATVRWMEPSGDRTENAAEASFAGQRCDRYQLLCIVGRGGFGEVWKAYDPLLQKHVAIKLQRPDKEGIPTAFLNEARKASSLRHPAIVQVHNVGEIQEGWYIVSEFIDGESLKSRLEAGRLSIERSVRIVATIAAALHAAHRVGLIHRDVKPANILLDRSEAAYLADFGLAVAEHEQRAQRRQVSGTLAYMAPEQIKGDTHLMDGRADLYSLGAVFYELLAGRPLFQADDFDEYRELILRREPRPLRSLDDAIPEELERICLKCLAKDMKDRYATAQDLAHDLGAWLSKQGRAPSASAWLQGAVAVSLVVSLVAGAAMLAQRNNALPGSSGSEQPTSAPLVQIVSPDPTPSDERREPTVKELIWPHGKRLSHWEVLPETQQLKVYCESVSLLQLGQTDADDWEFSATLTQFTGSGRIGLFLGYRDDPQTGAASFEVIRLMVLGEKAFLNRRTETYQSNAMLDPLVGVNSATVALQTLYRENTIRLVVRDNRLREVFLNGEPVPDLGNVDSPPPAVGPFGVFNRESDVVVSNALFNDRPILLLEEGHLKAAPELP